MMATDFVNHLFDRAGLTDTNLAAQLAGDMQSGAKTRADVLGQVIDMQQFQAREYNGAFVRMQYFGYLRRNPDAGGEAFWLDVLNNRVAGNYLAMVCAFTTSTEYQKRFSSVITHSNAECGR